VLCFAVYSSLTTSGNELGAPIIYEDRRHLPNSPHIVAANVQLRNLFVEHGR
jgi:hypothetical protein